jgi:hypothetical protein
MLRRIQPFIFLLVIVILAATALPGCASDSTSLPMSSMEHMPAEVKSAPAVVQQAYQFAAANPQVVKAIPCYCGCGSIGHSSNYSCYISGEEAGSLTYDNHALGCSICVDITQDAMRLTRQGKSPEEIRSYIDQVYGKYGTSNMPPE